jgi:multidrug efflux pump subunit AcrA (membrane-fusion protein)
MYARVELLIDRHPGAILVPSEAVTNEGDLPVVFVVDPSGVVGRRAITTGAAEDTLVEVTKGLQGSEAVIVDGKELVREGQKVRAEVKK